MLLLLLLVVVMVVQQTADTLCTRQQRGEEIGSTAVCARGGRRLHPLHPVVDVLHGLALDHGHLVEGEKAAHRFLLADRRRRLETQFVRQEAAQAASTVRAVAAPSRVAGAVG